MREGVRLADVRHPIRVAAELPTEPAMPPTRSCSVEVPPGSDAHPSVPKLLSHGSQFFLDVRTRAGDIAQVPLVCAPEMALTHEGPVDFADVRFRVLSISGYEGDELYMVWKLQHHVWEGSTRTAAWPMALYREREPDGYAEGRPYWF